MQSTVCNLLLSLMCELAVFVEALLYVILKAHELFSSVTVPLTTLAVAQAKNVNAKHEGSCVNLRIQRACPVEYVICYYL